MVDHLGRSAEAGTPGFPVVLTTLVPVGEEPGDVVARFPTIGRVAEHALATLHREVPDRWNRRRSEPEFHRPVILGHAGDQAGERTRPVVDHGGHVGGFPATSLCELDEGVGFIAGMEARTSRTQFVVGNLRRPEFAPVPSLTGPGLAGLAVLAGPATVRAIVGEERHFLVVNKFFHRREQTAGLHHAGRKPVHVEHVGLGRQIRVASQSRPELTERTAIAFKPLFGVILFDF